MLRSDKLLLPGGVSLALAATFASSFAALAHVHGEGHLDLAVDGSQVSISLRLPGDTVVGFEAAPRNAAQREAVQTAQRQLQALDQWLTLPVAAGCSADTVKVELPALLTEAENATSTAASADPHGHHAEAAHADADHDHAHDDHGHPEHAEHHVAEGADWQLAAEASCYKVEALTEFDLAPLFAALPRLQRLHIQYIGPGGQSGGALKRSQSRFALPDR